MRAVGSAVAQGLDGAPVSAVSVPIRATRKLATFLSPYWHWATLAPLLMVLEVAMDLMQPRLIQRIVD